MTADEARTALTRWRREREAAQAQLDALMARRPHLIAWAQQDLPGGIKEAAETAGISRTTASDDVRDYRAQAARRRLVKLLTAAGWTTGYRVYDHRGSVYLSLDTPDKPELDANDLNTASSLLNTLHDAHIRVELTEKGAQWSDRIAYVAGGGELRLETLGGPARIPRPQAQ